jgi:hypothetical protein
MKSITIISIWKIDFKLEFKSIAGKVIWILKLPARSMKLPAIAGSYFEPWNSLYFIVFTPRFVAKNNSFGPRPRYRKKLPAAAATNEN